MGYLYILAGNPKVPAAMDGPSTEIASSFILIWSRERNDRYYSLINCETGVFHTQGQNCDGHRVLCMTRVDNRTWLGTEVNKSCYFGKKYISHKQAEKKGFFVAAL